MVIKGDLTSASLVDVLQMLFNNGKEGTLRLLTPDATKSLYCSRKGITLIDPEILDKRTFGDVLISMEIVSFEVVEKILKEMKADQAVNKAFIEAGILNKGTIDQMIQLHMEEEICCLLRLNSGTFEFFQNWDGDIIPQEKDLPLIPLSTVLFESVRRMDEWENIKEHIGDLDTVFIKDSNIKEKDDPLTRSILEHVNGQRTVRQISNRLLIPPLEVAKNLADLVKEGIVKPADLYIFIAMAKDLVNNNNVKDKCKTLRHLKPNLKKILANGVDAKKLADLYCKEGDRKVAINLLLEKAKLMRRNHSKEDAGLFLEQANHIDPKDTRVLNQLAERCAQIGDKEGQIQHLISLAQVFLKAEQYERALQMCSQILDMDTSGTFVMNEIPRFSACKKDKEQGVELLANFVTENLPHFLLHARNKQGALGFLESLIFNLGRERNPEEVAGIYMTLVELETSQAMA